jgi:hypothetical protein
MKVTGLLREAFGSTALFRTNGLFSPEKAKDYE